jgi:hypothetical protein
MTKSTHREFYQITATDNSFTYASEFETLHAAIDFLKSRTTENKKYIIAWHSYHKQYNNGIFKSEITETHALYLASFVDGELLLDIV